MAIFSCTGQAVRRKKNEDESEYETPELRKFGDYFETSKLFGIPLHSKARVVSCRRAFMKRGSTTKTLADVGSSASGRTFIQSIASSKKLKISANPRSLRSHATSASSSAATSTASTTSSPLLSTSGLAEPEEDSVVLEGSGKRAGPSPTREEDAGRKNLIGLTRSELQAELTSTLNLEPFRFKQLWHWMYYRGIGERLHALLHRVTDL